MFSLFSNANIAHQKDPAHVISGLKATISNPNTSEDAKLIAQERLKELTGVNAEEEQHHTNRMLGKTDISLGGHRC